MCACRLLREEVQRITPLLQSQIAEEKNARLTRVSEETGVAPDPQAEQQSLWAHSLWHLKTVLVAWIDDFIQGVYSDNETGMLQQAALCFKHGSSLLMYG